MLKTPPLNSNRVRAAFSGGASAIAGLEFMEERFVKECGPLPVSATADVEELRRVKTARRSDLSSRPAIWRIGVTNISRM